MAAFLRRWSVWGRPLLFLSLPSLLPLQERPPLLGEGAFVASLPLALFLLERDEFFILARIDRSKEKMREKKCVFFFPLKTSNPPPLRFFPSKSLFLPLSPAPPQPLRSTQHKGGNPSLLHNAHSLYLVLKQRLLKHHAIPRTAATRRTVSASASPRATAPSAAPPRANAASGQLDAKAHVARGVGTDAPSVRSTPQK